MLKFAFWNTSSNACSFCEKDKDRYQLQTPQDSSSPTNFLTSSSSADVGKTTELTGSCNWLSLPSNFRCQNQVLKKRFSSRGKILSDLNKILYSCTKSATKRREWKHYKSAWDALMLRIWLILMFCYDHKHWQLTISLLIILLGIVSLLIHQYCMYPSHPDTDLFRRGVL